VPIMQVKLSSQLLQKMKLHYLGVGSKRRKIISDAASGRPHTRGLFPYGLEFISYNIQRLSTDRCCTELDGIYGSAQGEMKCG